eukprot:GDKJ01041104.1.p2 GENE.GDKJ01041104.1~~GDKJ01041104.1.p2  ORF type:complete len:220 (+),score=7.76 GDKJ01041104.1:392-1051(+)
MIEKYKSEILQVYEQKRDAGVLSPNLIHLTPANIRKEVCLLLSAGCDNTDIRMLKEFLDLPFEKQLSDVPFRKWDTDKFRPLCTFLKKRINTRDKNIELLAWLIDFHPRPFSNFWRLFKGKSGSLSELSITESGILEANNERQLNLYKQNMFLNNETPQKSGSNSLLANEPLEKEVLISLGVPINEKIRSKEITLEYPSGVKLSVDASDLSLIAELIKL